MNELTNANLLTPATSAEASGTAPRYPLDRLERVTGVFGNDALARSLGRTPDSVAKLRCRGLSWIQADEIAVAFGLLPYLVWPEWALHEPPDTWSLPVEDDVSLEEDLDLSWELASITIREEARA